MGYTPAEPLSGHSRGRSDTQETGGAERKEPEGRNQGCGSGKGGWGEGGPVPALPRPKPGRGPWGPSSPRLAAGRARGLAGRGGWGRGDAVYLGFAHVLPGPLELQPEIGAVRAALESVQLDSEDALHLQALPLHAGLGFGLHHDPFLRRRVAPGQEHGCPPAPRRREPAVSPGSRRGRLPSPGPGSPGHAPCSLRRAPRLGGSRGLGDPPTAAQAPVLRSSSLRRRLPRQSLPARGCRRGWDGRAPAALPSAPSRPLRPSASPSGTDSPVWAADGAGRDAGGRVGRAGGGGEGPGSLCLFHPSFGP